MTEKRFTIEIWQEGSLFYKDDKEDFSTHNSTSYVTNLVENKLNKLSDENEQLKREKERYKRLSEIRDENINNRILSLKEFINNCEDENVKNTLKDLFYSEVKEYDLAKENRKLKRENEQLKKENKELRQDNDIKFWKLQCMHYFNSISLFMSEISRAIKKGYEVSEQFQKYLYELKEDSKEIKEKNKRLFGDSDD